MPQESNTKRPANSGPCALHDIRTQEDARNVEVGVPIRLDILWGGDAFSGEDNFQ